MSDLVDWWDDAHNNNIQLWLTGSTLQDVANLHKIVFNGRVLEVGVGNGTMTHSLSKICDNDALDVSTIALAKIKSCTKNTYNNPEELPSNTYDIIVCHLVAQHVTDEELERIIFNSLRSLKNSGFFSLQFASKDDIITTNPSFEQLSHGGVLRTVNHVKSMVNDCGGRLVVVNSKNHSEWSWNCVRITK